MISNKVLSIIGICLLYSSSTVYAQSQTKIIYANLVKSKYSQVEPKFEIDNKIKSKLTSMQWEIKASKIGRPILSGNRYQLVNLVSGRGMKRQKRTRAANLGWLGKSSSSYNMKIQRKAGDGHVRYGDIIALHMS